jgi:hypothetical protein
MDPGGNPEIATSGAACPPDFSLDKSKEKGTVFPLAYGVELVVMQELVNEGILG